MPEGIVDMFLHIPLDENCRSLEGLWISVRPTYPTIERLCIDELWNFLLYCKRSMIKQSIAGQITQQSHLWDPQSITPAFSTEEHLALRRSGMQHFTCHLLKV